MQVCGGENTGPEVKMQVPGGDILRPELMSEGKETFLEKMKANGTLFEFNFILSDIFLYEGTLSLKNVWHANPLQM